MGWLTNLFNQKKNLPTVIGGIHESAHIPEPTRSLLFVTDEDPSKAVSPMTITVVVSLTDTGVKVETEDHHNLYGEPSLIWKKLPVCRNNSLTKDPIYYPSYVSLTAEQRFQYISWLRDITKPTNLSFVFLYYYGLERHMLVGDYDKATSEIFKLLQYHDKGSFRSYAQDALIATALFRKRLDIFEKNPFLFQGVSNEVLLMRRHLKIGLSAKEIMKLASSVGFKKNRYIKLYPIVFESELKCILEAFEKEHGSILEVVPWDDIKSEKLSVFANFSLPENIRAMNIPQLLFNQTFQELLKQMLESAHDNLKKKLKNRRDSGTNLSLSATSC